MPTTGFTRTFRSLQAGHAHTAWTVGTLVTLGLLGAWAVWAFSAQVVLYEVSENARLEVDRASYPVQAPLTGKIAVAPPLTVGQLVHAGDLLLQFDATAEKMQLQEERTRLAGFAPELTSLQAELSAVEQARDQEGRAGHVAAEEAQANARQAEAPVHYSVLEEQRLDQLHAGKLISEREYQRGRAEALQSYAAADRQKITVRRIEQEQGTRARDRDVQLRRLQSDITRLEGQALTSRAAIERLQNEVERRCIRAPVNGRLGDAAPLHAGAVLREGDKIGTILPGGELAMIAQFAPPAALGRIRPGQPARLRLVGFPWMQYGVVTATVSRVAGEVRDGSVRVELAINRDSARVPLQHGLPGSVEIEVEQTTPAALVLRHAGVLVATPHSAYGSISP